ncbi:hypothetical protein NO995_10025 [Aestuariibaculum sp. M13]|uniref:hypothetical protein n=1 Tax=Aestuariibaculum sp. M13 TaxID=2967132 RepID=UPI002159CC75|nr:hypothetical protein [Aestuariibaculum sp. M13]MCR8668019.1 hypothetical protein [Aestuariibaculum sp. M13]
MKTYKEQNKSIKLLFFAFIMLLQGCSVYRSNPTTIEHVIRNESKVKMVFKNNKTEKFEKIIIEEGNYYGVTIINGETIKHPLDQNEILVVKEKNKSLSTILGIGIPVVVLGTIFVLVGENNSYDFFFQM